MTPAGAIAVVSSLAAMLTITSALLATAVELASPTNDHARPHGRRGRLTGRARRPWQIRVGRQVPRSAPLLYTGSSGGAFVAWMDPELVRPAWCPAVATRGVRGPGEARSIRPAARSSSPRSTAASSGATSPVRSSRSVRSSATRSTGRGPSWSTTTGRSQWGSGPATSIRRRRWSRCARTSACSSTAARPPRPRRRPATGVRRSRGVATMRGGVGVDANGGLVWAGGRLTPAGPRQGDHLGAARSAAWSSTSTRTG